MWRLTTALPAVVFLAGLLFFFLLLLNPQKFDMDEDGMKSVKKRSNSFTAAGGRQHHYHVMKGDTPEDVFFGQRSLGESFVLICPVLRNPLTDRAILVLSRLLEERKMFFSTDIVVEQHDLCATPQSIANSPSTRAVMTLSVLPQPADDDSASSYLCFPGVGGTTPNLNAVSRALLFSAIHHLPSCIPCVYPADVVTGSNVETLYAAFKYLLSHLRSLRQVTTHNKIPNSRSVHILLHLRDMDDDVALEKLALIVIDLAEGVCRMNKDFHRSSFGWMAVRGADHHNADALITYMFYQIPTYLFIATIVFSAISVAVGGPLPLPTATDSPDSSGGLRAWKRCCTVGLVVFIVSYAGHSRVCCQRISVSWIGLVVACGVCYTVQKKALYFTVAVLEGVALAMFHASQSQEALVVGGLIAAQWVCFLNPSLAGHYYWMKITALFFFFGYLYLLSVFDELRTFNTLLISLMDLNATIFLFDLLHFT